MPKAATRRKKEPEPRGLTPRQTVAGPLPKKIEELRQAVEDDGGAVLASFKDPLGGNWQLLATLPIDKVKPTPFQRNLSEAHVKKLTGTIDKLDRFLDPIIAVREDDGTYLTPNGNHRLNALKGLGARSITALVIPEREMAYRILALNVEKAHTLREKALEVIRMARDLATLSDAKEKDYEYEFEEPAFLTLGIAYEQRGRFAGGAYHPILKRIDKFSGRKLADALAMREERVARIFELDDLVTERINDLKERGFESPYLRNFVLARINPLRFTRGQADFDETIDKMIRSAQRFDAAKVKAEQVAQAGGPPEA